MFDQEEKDAILNDLASLADRIRKDKVSSIIWSYTLEEREEPGIATARVGAAGDFAELDAMCGNIEHYIENSQ